MSESDYCQLPVGHEFPRSTFRMDGRKIDSYLKAVEEPGATLREVDSVPPMAIAAAAMGALAEQVNFPFGAIHLTQELDFKYPVMPEETLICSGTLLSRNDRKNLHLLTIGLNVYNQRQQLVMAGKTGFILPRTDLKPGGNP